MFILCGALSLGTIWYTWGYTPQQHALSDAKAETVRLQEEIQKGLADQAAIPELTTQQRQKTFEYTAFSRRVPPQEDVYGLVDQIGALANQSQVQIRRIERAVSEGPSRGVITTRLPITLEGGFNSFYRFMTSVLQEGRYLNLQEVQIGLQEGGINASFQVEAYTYRP